MQERLSYKFDFSTSSEKPGRFTGYGSVFGNVDSYDDIVVQGAFASTINNFGEKKKLPILWQHDASNPIGVYDSMQEDGTGLLLEGQINLDVQRGRETYALLKQGAINGLSIGYAVKKYEMNQDTNIRLLKELDLYEVSLVTFPANDRARVTSVKTADEIKTIRDLEKYLRDAGFSRSEALRVASRFQLKNDPSDSDCYDYSTELNQYINILKR